ncbi:ABC transporter ATP-binding protein [Microcoleus sp. S36b_A3]|uniref:ABC transporter ATP-binding protein n=1 Tax=Microcoleaceae TaxID=1892252 RepID=UPI00187F428B|nr:MULTISPECIES: ABC transporter ATP-binding protein [unclassified Tychonema]MBE9123836.1 ABC transporter ATP-binding protein [Tychonema sp. LEGE 07199]MBE9132636.1 ABC transporter ATP-binding protein [Tychonema sp. LEGE 07196]
MFQTALNQGTTATDTALDVELRKVFKVFNGETAVRGVDISIRQGEFFSILGPSGCGKTTTLRLIAGFETPSAGELMIRGQSMTNTPAYRRPVNTVFQSYALFGHMNVWDNIAFGLRIKKLGKTEIEERVREVLQLVKMESFANRFPGQMSGGQQQRVALARALVNRPAVLLLDEPLGALDLKLRKQMQLELSNLHQELGLTFVMVTHDQEEAMSLSDRIAVMHEGRIEQIGSPEEIYECPQTAFVADFIGDTNLFSGTVESIDRSTLTVRTSANLKIIVQQSDMWNGVTGDSVVVSVRPEKVYLNLYQPEVSVNCFEGRLKNTMYMGTHVHYVVELTSGDKITVRQPNTGGSFPDQNTPIYAYWGTTDCLALGDRS